MFPSKVVSCANYGIILRYCPFHFSQFSQFWHNLKLCATEWQRGINNKKALFYGHKYSSMFLWNCSVHRSRRNKTLEVAGVQIHNSIHITTTNSNTEQHLNLNLLRLKPNLTKQLSALWRVHDFWTQTPLLIKRFHLCLLKTTL